MRLADAHLPDAASRPPGDLSGAPIPVRNDVAWLRTAIVNVVFLGPPNAGDGGWVLVDTGMYGFAEHIARAAERRFGDARPAAIVLTHGHFDHVGSLRTLAERWDVPIYAHPLELPYLTGRSAYPPPDPSVGGGAMARLSPLYPPGPFDFGDRVRALPDDGSVPGAPSWRTMSTPGHSPGHVSFVRDGDRTAIVGDAFVTTKQESAMAAYSQRIEMHGPPMYYTCDWDAARDSVRRLAAFDPALAITGHGQPMQGDALREGLQRIAQDFDRTERPPKGRYAQRPAIADETGVVELPPPVTDYTPLAIAGVAATLGLLAATVHRDHRGR